MRGQLERKQRGSLKSFESFDNWLAKKLDPKGTGSGVEDLLKKKTAVRFLVAWSLFEQECFEGFCREDKLLRFSQEVKPEIFSDENFASIVKHFFERYQDENKLKNLKHKGDSDVSKKFIEYLKKDFLGLQSHEKVFLVVFTVFRYRNNIFHGNKGVQSWLKYDDQIRLCIEAMQLFIDHV